MTINIGQIKLANNVAVAPMSGVSDLPFRRIAARFGAGLVISEMVASEELARARPDVVRRAEGDPGVRPFVVQLAGREARWMAEGARLAEAAGADIIDINMGCPSRQVTGALSGSALMRDLDHALRLIEATIGATATPVTLKMRLGWDRDSLNAPELAHRAEAAGVHMVTIHGRTRNQFFKGAADWVAAGRVVEAVSIPVLINGDIVSLKTARQALKDSGAAGVMIGRASVGRPWLAGAIAETLQTGASEIIHPSLDDQARAALCHYDQMIAHYGELLGVKMARKHLAAYIEHAPVDAPFGARRSIRADICRLRSPAHVRDALGAFYASDFAFAGRNAA